MATTLKEQAWHSGLVLSDWAPQWNENDWPPLEGGWRNEHATVVLDHPDTDNENNNKRQTVVVLGGYQAGQGSLDSILVLKVAAPDKHWREGPSMNKSRRGHAAVGCNGGVYVIGGNNGRSHLDCIERIDIKNLLHSRKGFAAIIFDIQHHTGEPLDDIDMSIINGTVWMLCCCGSQPIYRCNGWLLQPSLFVVGGYYRYQQ